MEVTLWDSEVPVDHDGNGRVKRLQDLLTEAVREILADEQVPDDSRRVIRVTVPVPDVPPLQWLRAQRGASRFYWRGRDRLATPVATFGVADEVRGEDMSVLERVLTRHDALVPAGMDELRYFGGSAFDVTASADDEWSAFPPVWFFLPRFELGGMRGNMRLVCNVMLPRDRRDPSALFQSIALLRSASEARNGRLPLPNGRVNLPDRRGWESAIDSTLSLLEGEDVGKVVLARKSILSFDEPVDPFLLLDRLEAITPGCFHFLVEPDAGTAFVGASPERLYRRNGRSIESEAVAGTRPRGTSVLDDERLRDELLLSDKDRREHQFVERSIREVLQGLTEHLDVDADTSEMTLARGRHLYSGVQGVLRHDVGDLDLLRALHPTPAVGGYPTAEAMRAIAEIEPFARGWYAGPVGWISRSASEFAVAIRTGLVSANELTLYSGAGIVTGSEAQAEWEEIEHKIGDFTNVLGLDLEREKY